MSTSGPNFIGIDLSGPNVRAALLSDEGRVLERREAVISSDNLVELVAKVGRELGAGDSSVAATGIRVELENDANAAAYGEYKVGAGRGSRDIFYMMIGTGIGGAVILDGKLWTGASGFAG